jgi:hypothetical protein
MVKNCALNASGEDGASMSRVDMIILRIFYLSSRLLSTKAYIKALLALGHALEHADVANRSS